MVNQLGSVGISLSSLTNSVIIPLTQYFLQPFGCDSGGYLLKFLFGKIDVFYFYAFDTLKTSPVLFAVFINDLVDNVKPADIACYVSRPLCVTIVLYGG